MCWKMLTLVAMLWIAYGAESDLLVGVRVPEYAFPASTVSITCEYDLRQTQLYSLKWYHNRAEFYRYVPTERAKPINIRPTHHFKLHEISRTERRLILKLSELSPYSSGEYQCEVIAEHPSFRTERQGAAMIVLSEPFYPPVITQAREMYEQDEVIKIGCQPRNRFRAPPRPALLWFLNGQEAKPEYLSQYGYRPGLGYYGYYLQVPAKEIADSGGTIQAECALVLGNLRQKTTRMLRVRRKVISYVNSTHVATGGSSCWWRTLSFPTFLLVYFKLSS